MIAAIHTEHIVPLLSSIGSLAFIALLWWVTEVRERDAPNRPLPDLREAYPADAPA